MFPEEEKSSAANNGNVGDERDSSLGYGPPSGSSSAIPSLEPPPDSATNTATNYRLNMKYHCTAAEKDPDNMTNLGVMKKPDLYEEIESNQPLEGACGPLTPGKWR